jgi:excisionase family DNA binding protein
MSPPTLSGPALFSAPVPWSAAGDCLRRTLTTSQASAYTGISVSTLEKRRVYGGGPAFLKLGRSVRYRIQDLDAFLDEHGYRSTSEYTRH